MKRISVVIAATALMLTGCGSVFILNFAGVTRTAATTGTPMPPEVQCAALASSKIEAYGLAVEAIRTCLSAVEAQKLIDEKQHKAKK